MAFAGVAARVVNAGLVFLTQVLYARVMGVADFGVFAAANTIFLLLASFATLGSRSSRSASGRSMRRPATLRGSAASSASRSSRRS